MIPGNNYRLVQLMEKLINEIYTLTALQHSNNFGLHDNVREAFLNHRNNTFMEGLDDRLKELNVVQDVRNLNIPFKEFVASNEVLKHKIITLGRVKLYGEEIYSTLEDNASYVKDTSKNMASTVATILDTVNPLVKSTIGRVKDDLARITETHNNVNYTTTKLTMPLYVQTLVDNESLDIDSSLNQIFDADFSKSSYSDYMKAVTKTSVSSEIDEYLSELSPNKIKATWDKYLVSANLNRPEWHELGNMGKYETYEDLFIIYGLVTNMIDNKVNSTLSMVDHNRVVSLILNYLNNKLTQRYKIYINDLVEGKVIVNVNGTDVFLNYVNFNKAVAEGVTIDTILGSVINTDNYITVEQLKLNNGILTNSWIKYQKQLTVLNSAKYKQSNLIALIHNLKVVADDLGINKEQAQLVLNNIEESDLTNIEETITFVILAFMDSPILTTFYEEVSELRLEHNSNDTDISFIAALATYGLITTTVLSKLNIKG